MGGMICFKIFRKIKQRMYIEGENVKSVRVNNGTQTQLFQEDPRNLR